MSVLDFHDVQSVIHPATEKISVAYSIDGGEPTRVQLVRVTTAPHLLPTESTFNAENVFGESANIASCRFLFAYSSLGRLYQVAYRDADGQWLVDTPRPAEAAGAAVEILFTDPTEATVCVEYLLRVRDVYTHPQLAMLTQFLAMATSIRVVSNPAPIFHHTETE